MLLDAAMAGTRARAQKLIEGEPLQQALLAWLHPDLALSCDLNRLEVELAARLKSPGRSVQAVAALGFVAGAGAGAADTAVRDAFLGGVQWVTGRRVVASGSSAALVHPMSLLGVIVGALACADSVVWNSLRDWYASLSEQVSEHREASTPLWHFSLTAFIRWRLGEPMDLVPVSTEANAVLLALASRRMLTLEMTVTNSDAAAANVLHALKRLAFADSEEAAFNLAAYQHLAATSEHPRLKAPDLHDVALALSRLQAALRRWTWESAPKVAGGALRKWHVDHEYHFQNLLTAIFTPLFSDLKDEEWLSSLGPKKPRADLVIPSLKLVIEVKFWRAGVSASAVVSQVAEDVGLYGKRGSPYVHVVPVIWDNAARSEQHAYLIRGLSDLPSVVHATVVARPAFMIDDEASTAAEPVRKRRVASSTTRR